MEAGREEKTEDYMEREMGKKEIRKNLYTGKGVKKIYGSKKGTMISAK